MWSSFIDQIQQRLDDAADLLGDEEGEEVEVERSAPLPSELPKPASTVSSSTQPTALRTAPSEPTAGSTGDNAQGWDDDDMDELLPTASEAPPPSTATAASPKDVAELPTQTANGSAPLAALSTAAAAVAAVVAKSPSPLGKLQDAESPSSAVKTTAEDEDVEEGGAAAPPAVEASESHIAASHEVPEVKEEVSAAPAEVETEANSMTDTPPTSEFPLTLPTQEEAASKEVHLTPTTPEEPAATTSPPSADVLVAPATSSAAATATTTVITSTAVEPSPPKEPAAQPEKAAEPPESGPAAPHSTDAAEERAPQPAAPTPQDAVVAAPSPPPPPKANRSSEEAQLLRFQQLLAEEMENVAGLQKANLALKGRVSVLEGELANASARLASAANSEQQISMLIEKLGKEKERHKAVANERSELEEHIQDLEEELEEYRVKEQSWIGGSEQQKQNENAAQQRIAQLEKELRARDSLTEELNVRVRETAHQNSVLQHQVEELKASYSTQLNTVKESNSDTVDQLRREVEQLRTSLHNLSAEYDARTAELEREVQQSTMRAHQAETRFSEVEFGSVSALQDLRNELEDSQRSIATWKAEAQKARGEYAELLDQYALLKRSRSAAETDLRERIASDAAAMTELRNRLREWEERHTALQETLRAAQSQSEEQQKTILLLEAANQKLKTVTAESFNRSHSEASLGSLAPTKATSLEVSLSSSPLLGRPAGRAAAVGVPMNPFTHRERAAWGDYTDRKTRERLEQEVLRQAAELEALRRTASEAAEWKGKFGQLQTEHDLLLQLYGQLEDDVDALKRERPATVAAPAAASAASSPSTPQ